MRSWCSWLTRRPVTAKTASSSLVERARKLFTTRWGGIYLLESAKRRYAML